MEREFIYTHQFTSKWYETLKLTEDLLEQLERYIIENPTAGDIMRGTGGIRKLRFALPDNGKGKSGGLRILEIDFVKQEKVIMFDLFSKNEKENLSQAERNELKKVVQKLREELEK